MTYDQRVILLGRLAASFPRDNVSGSTISEYARDLESIPVHVLSEIVADIKRGARSFPPMADIWEAYYARRRRDLDALPSGEPAAAVPMPESVRKQLEEIKAKSRIK